MGAGTDPGPGYPGGIILFRLSVPAVRPDKAEGPLLCLAQEPQFHQRGAGQRPRRQRPGAGLRHPGVGGAPGGRPDGGSHRQAGTQDQVLALPHASANRPGSPGKCPMCGMDLVPMQAEEAPAPAAPAPGAPAAPPKERKIKYWVSPMDPGYVRDKPGKAPCGMDMVPVYEDTGEERQPRAPLRFRPPPSSPWGCGPPRWKSVPCPGIP